jgi:hypothetical protein
VRPHRLRRGPLLLLVAIAGCGGGEPPALTVGPVAYSNTELLGLSDSRRELLVGLTALGLAVADSTTADLGRPLLDEWADDRLIDILAAELTLERNGIGEEVLRARYEVDPDWELTVRHLLVFSERWRADDHRVAARAKAERGLALLGSGTDFPAVEAALATEGGAEAREGTLPPSREGALVPEFWAAALALDTGELSPVTETQYGFHVLQLLDRQEVPFEDARSTLVREVAPTVDNPSRVFAAWVAERGADDAARREAALEEARSRGLRVSAADEAELLRAWETDVLSWSTALGLRQGLTPEQVGQAALAALASSGQLADIARRELSTHLEALRSRYPVTTGTP